MRWHLVFRYKPGFVNRNLFMAAAVALHRIIDIYLYSVIINPRNYQVGNPNSCVWLFEYIVDDDMCMWFACMCVYLCEGI